MASRSRVRLLLVAAGLATVATYVGVFLSATTDDRADQFDEPTVRDGVSAACSDLRTAVDALAPLGAGARPAERAARVGEQDRLLGRFVGQVRALGPAFVQDEPGEVWLDDWEVLAEARRQWVRAGAAGPFAPPVEDGRPITARMEAVGVQACRVPIALTAAP